MSRKDYELLAGIIKRFPGWTSREQHEQFADFTSAHLSEAYANFKGRKFMRASLPEKKD